MATAQERDVQRGYWLEHSAQPTVEAMMLDSKAADIDKHERPEVCGGVGGVSWGALGASAPAVGAC